MAGSVPDSRGPGFSTARVFGRAFGTVTANPLAALGIVLLFGVLPSEVYSYAARSLPKSGALFDALMVGKILAGWAVGAFCNTLVQGAFIGLTSAYDADRRTGFLAAAGAGMRSLIPLIGLGLITSLGTTIGFVALVVPGVLLGLIWIVSAPVLVEERCGAIAALSRSRALTQGARWPILGIAILMVASLLAVWFLQVFVTFRFSMSGYAFTYTTLLLIRIVIGAILKLCSAAVYTSIYVELRNWKHGAPKDALAQIFA